MEAPCSCHGRAVDLRAARDSSGCRSGALMTGVATDSGVRVAAMDAGHAAEVLEIYQVGLDEGDASFETAAPDWATFDRSRLAAHRFVALDGRTGAVLGWVACTAVSDR